MAVVYHKEKTGAFRGSSHYSWRLEERQDEAETVGLTKVTRTQPKAMVAIAKLEPIIRISALHAPGTSSPTELIRWLRLTCKTLTRCKLPNVPCS
jgi:hypothetical protein